MNKSISNNYNIRQADAILFEGDTTACTLLLPYAFQLMRMARLNNIPVMHKQVTADDMIRVEYRDGLGRIYIKAKAGYRKPGYILGLMGFNYDMTGLGKYKKAILLAPPPPYWQIDEFNYPLASDPPQMLPYFVHMADVYLLHGGSIYKNAQLYSGNIIDSGELPVFIYDSTFVLAHDYSLKPLINFEYAAEYAYTWEPEIVSSGKQYHPGVRVENVLGQQRFHFLAINETTAGAVQFWWASLYFTGNVPWLDFYRPEDFFQMNVYGTLFATGGWDSTSQEAPPSPVTQFSNRLAAKSVPGGGAFGGWIESDGYISYAEAYNPSLLPTVYHYNKDLSTTLDIEIYPEFELNVSRSAVINAKRGDSTLISWLGINSEGPICYSSFLVSCAGMSYFHVPAAGNAPPLYVGDPYTGVGNQQGPWLEMSSTAKAQVTCDQLPYPIHDAESIYTINGKSISWGNNEYYVPDGFVFGEGTPGTISVYTNLLSINHTAGSVETATYGEDITIEARDYLFVDTDNDCFVWFEMAATGTSSSTYGESWAAESTVKFYLKAKYRDIEFEQEIYALNEIDDRLSMPNYEPIDVDFGSSPNTVRWVNPDPPMPKPIFTPLWFAQGLCPYIAYNEREETEDYFLFSCRVQITKINVPIGYSPPTPPPNTLTVQLPNIEKACWSYGVPFYLDMDLLWPNVRFSSPGGGEDWVKILLPEYWPVPDDQSYDYPSQGTYQSNDNDHLYTNIYRT